VVIRLDVAASVDGLAQRIDNSSDIAVAHRHAGPFARPGYFRTLADLCVASEKDASDLILADVLDHSLQSVLESKDLPVHGVIDPVDRSDPVAHGDDSADFTVFAHCIKILDLFPQDR